MKKSFFHGTYYREYREELKENKTDLTYLFRSVDYAKRDGFQGIEVLPIFEFMKGDGTEFADDYLDVAKRFREKMDKEGIKASCFSFGVSVLNDPDYARRVMKKSADVAAIVGSPYLHHTFQCSLSHNNIRPENTFYQGAEKTFVEFGREIAEYAGEKGLECIYEDQGYYVNTVERLGSLIAAIDMPNTGVCLDVGNSFFYDVLPESFAGAFASIIKHVHIKDYIKNDSAIKPGNGWDRTISGSWLRNCVPGTGIVNFEKIFSILLEAGYDGFFSLENQNALDNISNAAAIKEIGVAMNNIERIYNKVLKTVGNSRMGV